MRRCTLIAMFALLMLVQSRAAFAQATTIPVFCDITASQKEVQAGAPVIFTVSLKNMKDEPVVALADTSVTVTSDSFAAPVQVVVPKGQRSAATTVVMTKSGVGRVKASVPNWPAAFTIVPVRPAQSVKVALPASVSSPELIRGSAARAMLPPPVSSPVRPAPDPSPASPAGSGPGRARIMRGTVPQSPRSLALADRVTVPAATPSAPAPPAPAPGAPGTAVAALALDVQVTPEQVHPRARVWAADVTVLLLTDNGTLATADRDLPLQLFTRVGEIAPRTATIRAGDSSTAATPIRLTSDRPGDELITALSTIAHVTRAVTFDSPAVASLRVAPTPAEVVNDGRAVVNVAVMLQDADGHITDDTARDFAVHLQSSSGTLGKTDITVTKGQPSAETTLTSTRYGTATITATGVGLEGMGTVTFSFPWLMLALAVAGGAGGSFAREGFGRTRGRRSPIVRHLALGAIFGVVFYALVLFGAVGSVPKLSIEIGRIIPLNEIGALALGFIGGIVGNRLWTLKAG